MILILSNSCIQGNLITLILPCSYLLANSSCCAQLVLVGFRDPGAQPTSPELGEARWNLQSETGREGSVRR